MDIAFVAHSHTYERTCPMRGGSCAEAGVVYLNSSAGAASARSVDDSRAETVSYDGRSDDYDCTQILVQGRGDWQHFCHVGIAGCTATVDCYAHDYWESNLTPHDTLIIEKADCQEPDDSDPIGVVDAGVPATGDARASDPSDAGEGSGPDQGGHAD